MILFINILSTEFRVEISAPKGKIRVIEGDDLTLSCIATRDWHSCTWRKASIKKICRFEYSKITGRLEWKTKEIECDLTYRDPTFNSNNDRIWYDPCGKGNRKCTITLSKAQLSDADDWNCEVEPCEMIEGIGCTQKGGVAANVSVNVEVRCLDIKY